jgi:hypothetical protein
MEITGAHVNWFTDCANDPELVVHVEQLDTEPWIWAPVPEEGPHRMWFSKTEEGWVKFLAENKTNQNGYGGHVMKLHMADGTIYDLKGPWSSRASVLNSNIEAFGGEHIMEVLVKPKKRPAYLHEIAEGKSTKWMPETLTYHGFAMVISKVKEVLETYLPGVILAERRYEESYITNGNEVHYYPVSEGEDPKALGRLEEPKEVEQSYRGGGEL